ncbi:MAG: histidine kinase [Bacteroidales bacterium]
MMIFRAISLRLFGNSFIAFLIIALLASLSLYLLFRSDLIAINKYRIKDIQDKDYLNRGQHYYDLEFDGKSEYLVFTHYAEIDVVEVYDDRGAFFDILKPSGNFLNEVPAYFIGDTDHDLSAEIYLFTLRNDSVLMNGYELMGNDGHFLQDHYITGYKTNGLTNNIRLVEVAQADLDGAGNGEIIFTLRAGYSLLPRKVVSVDPWSGKTNRSENSAASYNSMNIFRDQSGKVEQIVTGTSAYENFDINDSIQFTDHHGWILSYSPDLASLLMVKEYPNFKPYVFPVMLSTSSGPFIYALVVEMYRGMSFLEKISAEGETLKRIKVGSGLNKYLFLNTLLKDLNPLVILHSDTLYYYDHALTLLKKESGAGVVLIAQLSQSDEMKGTAGFIPFLSGDKLVLRDTDLNIVAEKKGINSNLNEPGRYFVKTIFSPDHYEIAFSFAAGTMHFEVWKNRFYGFRLMIFVLIYSLLFALFYLLFRLQNHFYNKRYKTQHKILELQLQTVQNQLQPHFTFNVLNTIGSMIYKDKKDKAYEYLNYFSDLLRSTLLSRARPDWQIGEELNFISTYMEMENLRFNNRFSYHQGIRQGTDLTKQVPRLAIQAFVENAVRHGLMHKKGDGRLSVLVEQTDTHVRVVVEDNGIGRDASARIQRQKIGVGNEILKDYMEIYNRSNKTKFKFTIEDLTDVDGSAAGTKVELMIPGDFRSSYPKP